MASNDHRGLGKTPIYGAELGLPTEIAMTATRDKTACKFVSLPQREDGLAPHLHAPILIEPGEYELRYTGHRVGKHFQRAVLTVWFSIPEFEIAYVPRYYRVQARRNGSGFAAPRHGFLVDDFRRLFTRPLNRLDRFPVTWLDGITVIGEIGTVTKDYERSFRDDETRYSVVRKLIKAYE